MTTDLKNKPRNGEPLQSGEKGTPLVLMGLPMGCVEEVQRIANEAAPGVSTVRVPPSQTAILPQTCHETEVELGFLCKKCRTVFGRESWLLAHQRGICYPGQLADGRGAVRLLATQYECTNCSPPRSCVSVQDFCRHDAEVHNKSRPFKPDSGLTHEMENVVNQITALAAQVAQETSPDTNANFAMKKDLCESSQLVRVQAALPIYSSGQ